RRSRDDRAARHAALRGCAGRAGRAGAAPGKGRAAARGIARRLRARHRAGALARAAAGRGRAAGRGAAQVRGREARAPLVRERRGVGGVDLERYLAARARLVERALAARFPPARTRLRQALDLAAEGSRPSLRRVQDIHRRKTGALLRSAVRVGALVAGADARTLRRLTAYGEHLGLAFQIADDILDAAGGPEADGRTDRE